MAPKQSSSAKEKKVASSSSRPMAVPRAPTRPNEPQPACSAPPSSVAPPIIVDLHILPLAEVMGSAAGILSSNYLEDLSHVEFPISGDEYPKGRKDLILAQGERMLLSMISGEPLTHIDGTDYKKPAFLFGDAIDKQSQTKPKRESWAFSLDGTILYLPSINRDFPISDFHHATHPRRMAWNLTQLQHGKPGKIFYQKKENNPRMFACASLGSTVPFRGLLPGLVPSEETSLIQPVQMATFCNGFADASGLYSTKNPRTNGWLHPNNLRWAKLTGWILNTHKVELEMIGLYDTIATTDVGLPINHNLFLSLVERYNSYTGTFATPIGEIGLALHEMAHISKLPMGEIPYEEYIPTNKELQDFNEKSPNMIVVYHELMCHYMACTVYYPSTSDRFMSTGGCAISSSSSRGVSSKTRF